MVRIPPLALEERKCQKSSTDDSKYLVKKQWNLLNLGVDREKQEVGEFGNGDDTLQQKNLQQRIIPVDKVRTIL